MVYVYGIGKAMRQVYLGSAQIIWAQYKYILEIEAEQACFLKDNSGSCHIGIPSGV